MSSVSSSFPLELCARHQCTSTIAYLARHGSLEHEEVELAGAKNGEELWKQGWLVLASSRGDGSQGRSLLVVAQWTLAIAGLCMGLGHRAERSITGMNIVPEI